ncbi:hypothetical protein HMI56_005067 [Coelomomyces lativittatus]|nr:hypothetical protein HMI56_005067 [Coelomomyces lativittatus]
MWTSLAENTIVPNFKLTSFLNVDIPVPDENKTCSSFKNVILLFDRTFYDITFALGHMGYGFNPDYAEHYIADTGNMLPSFFKYGNFKNFNFRLLATYYVSSMNILTTTNLKYRVVYFNPTNDKNIWDVGFETSRNFANTILQLWEFQSRNPPFSFESIVHPRIYMKHIFHSSPQTTMYALARKFNPSFKLSNINELNLQSNAIVLVPHI